MLEIAKAPAGFFRPLKAEHPYVKLDVYGEAGSGKSWLLASVAAGLSVRLGRVPVVYLGTEHAAASLVPVFEAQGVEVLHRETREIADLLEVMRLAREGAFSVVVVDSRTHFWEGWVETCKAQLGVSTRPLSPSEKGDIKSEWRRKVAEPYVTDPVHYLGSFRAGAEYEGAVDADTQRRESWQSGIRLRGESDTGHESEIVVRLERLELRGPSGLRVVRQGVVEKDRTNTFDGRVIDSPSWVDFDPAVEKVLARAQATKATVRLAAPEIFRGPSSASQSRQRDQRRALLLEEVRAWLDAAFPGSGKDSVKGRNDLSAKVFGTFAASFPSTLELEVLEVKAAHLRRLLLEGGYEAPSAVLLEEPSPAPSPVAAPVDPLAEIRAGLDAAFESPGAPSTPPKGDGAGAGAPPATSTAGIAPATPEKPSSARDGSSSGASSMGGPVGGEAKSLTTATSRTAVPPSSSASAVPATPAPGPSSGPETSGGSSSRSGVPGAPESLNAGPAPDSALGQSGPSAVAAPVPAASSGPKLRPCFFCERSVVSSSSFWLLLALMIDRPGVRLAEGLYRARVGATQKREAGADGERRWVSLEAFDCEDVCEACGTRENAGGTYEPEDAGCDECGALPGEPCEKSCLTRHPLSDEIEEACEEAEAAPMPSAPAPRVCPINQCDGSGFHKAGTCLCKTGVTIPKKSEAAGHVLTLLDFRARLGADSLADGWAMALCNGDGSELLGKDILSKILTRSDREHGKARTDASWEGAGFRLAKNGKRLGLGEARKASVRAFVNRLPILETAQDRQSPEKDGLPLEPLTDSLAAPTAEGF